MQNFDTAVTATATSLNSAGSAASENSKAMESVSKKIKAFQGQLQELILGEGGLTKFIDSIIDAGTGVLKFANSDLGKLIIQITATTVALGILYTVLNSASIASALTLFLNLGANISTDIVLMNGLTESTATFRTVLEALNINPVVLGVTALTAGVLLLGKAVNYYYESTEELKSNLNDIIDSTNKLVSEQQALAEKFKEGTITENESARLSLLNAQIEANKTLIQQEYEKASASQQQDDSSKAVFSNGNKHAKVSVTTESGALGVNTEKASVQDLADAYNTLDKIKSTSLDEDSKITTKKQELISALSQEGQNLLNLQNQGVSLNKYDTDRLSLINSLVDAYNKQTSSTDGSTNATNSAVDASEDATNSAEDETDATEKLAESVGVTKDQLKSFADEAGVSEQALVDQASAMGLNVEQTSAYMASMSAFNDSIDSIQSSYKTLSSAVEEYNKNGSYSLDTLQSLLALDPKYLDMIDLENGKLVINESAIKAKVEAQAAEAKQTIYNTAIAKLNAIANEKAGMASLTSSADKANSVGGINSETEALESNTKAKVKNAFAKAISSGGSVSKDEANTVLKEMNEQISLVDSAVSGLGKNFATSMGTAEKSSKKSEKAVDKVTEALQKQKDAIDATKDALEDQKDALEKNKDQYTKAISYINKQFDKQKDAINAAKDAQLKAIDAEIDALNKQKDSVTNNIKSQISDLQAEKDAREDYWDSQIDALKRANEEQEKNIKLEQLQEALAQAQSSKVMVYQNGSFQYGQDESAVSEASQNLSDYQDELAYDAQLQQLEDMKQAEMDSYDARILNLQNYEAEVEAQYDAQISALQDYRDQQEALYEAQLQDVQDKQDAFQEMVDATEEQEEYLAAVELQATSAENDNWTVRLANLQNFVNSYNALLAQIGSIESSIDSASSQSKSLSNQIKTSKANYKASTTKHASGVASIASDEMSLVGDSPNTELVVGSKINGVPMKLSSGDGVVNAKSTSTISGILNSIGSLANGNSSVLNTTSKTNSNNISIGNITLPEVKDGKGLVDYLQNFANDMTQQSFAY